MRVALARRTESVKHWSRGGRRTGTAHAQHDGPPFVFIGFIFAVAVVLVLGLWLVGIALVRA